MCEFRQMRIGIRCFLIAADPGEGEFNNQLHFPSNSHKKTSQNQIRQIHARTGSELLLQRMQESN